MSSNQAMTISEFRERFDFAKRKSDVEHVLNNSKFKGKVPILIFRASNNHTLEALDKIKYCVPVDQPFQFLAHKAIRKRLTLAPDVAMFCFVVKFTEGNETGAEAIAPSSDLIGKVYEEYKSDDGYLYVTYSGESTLGGNI